METVEEFFFVVWVRLDNLSVSNTCFTLGPVQFPSDSYLDLFIWGSFRVRCVVTSS